MTMENESKELEILEEGQENTEEVSACCTASQARN